VRAVDPPTEQIFEAGPIRDLVARKATDGHMFETGALPDVLHCLQKPCRRHVVRGEGAITGRLVERQDHVVQGQDRKAWRFGRDEFGECLEWQAQSGQSEIC
jgi:hypothetical protein